MKGRMNPPSARVFPTRVFSLAERYHRLMFIVKKQLAGSTAS
jgi:hypothetical protein